MVARKRKDTEDFKKYRENLKEEAARLKEYLRGKLVWASYIHGTYKRGE